MASALRRLVKKKPDEKSSYESNVRVPSELHFETKKHAGKSESKSTQIVSVPKTKSKKEENKGRLEVRSKRLMREFLHISKSSDCSAPTFQAELVEESLFEWNVKLFTIDPDSPLHNDMHELGHVHILLNLSFPENFPFSPPFMRVVKPRIEGGFVLDGGAICMELLTPAGWSSAYTVEAMIMQFAALVVKGKGRIDKKCHGDFNKREAETSFKRLVKTHERYGWITPPKSEG